jgi:hypothetical protein
MEDTDQQSSEEQARAESDMDSLYILPLHIIPLQTSSLKRARMIKNVRLESVIELFNDTDGGSGQIDISELPNTFGWPLTSQHPDARTISALAGLHSFDVYTLRNQLRQIGINVEQEGALQLSQNKRGELMTYMNEFTFPLLRQIYDSADSNADNISQLVQKYKSPDKQDTLDNLKLMADRLGVAIHEVPDFLEEYADIYLSVSYGKYCLNQLIPQIIAFEESMEKLKENLELSNDGCKAPFLCTTF